jgi:zinc transport system substrate-binding protein
MKALARLLFVSVLLSAAAAAPAPSGKLRILATVLPLQEFAAAVAGDKAEVKLLLPAGAGVHNWQPRPGDIARLAECDLLLFIGAGLEPWLPGLLKALPPGHIRTLEAAAGLELLGPEEDEAGEEAHDHGAFDPHVWLDFALDVRIVERIATELARLDPRGGPGFGANAAALSDRLRALDAKFRDGLAGCQGKDVIVAGHGAFGYLARRYGLVQTAVYGLSPDALPKPRDLMRVVDLCRKKGISTVFFENSVPPDVASTLAREIGGGGSARVLVLHAGHNRTRDEQRSGVGFFRLMEQNLEALRLGLGCR